MDENKEEKHEGCQGQASLLDIFTFKYRKWLFTLRARDLTEEEDIELQKVRKEMLDRYAPDKIGELKDAERWAKTPEAETSKFLSMRIFYMLGGRRKLVPGPFGEGWDITDEVLLEQNAKHEGKILEVTLDNFMKLPVSLRRGIEDQLIRYYFPAFTEAERKNSSGR